MDIATYLVLSLFSFGRTLVGIIFRPYETYRRIIDKSYWGELLYIALILGMYFALASLVKTASFRPYLLTRQFVKLGSATGLGYLFMILGIWITGTRLGGIGKLRGVGMAWAYTLVPTVLWFLMTSILYVILPPPRTTSVQGIAFSILYLVISTAILFWKVTLGYLTMRFGLKMNLQRIIVTVLILSPAIALYTVFMYRLGVFRVPFL